MKVYEAIASALISEGCGPFFGLMGDGNMYVWSALAQNPLVKIYSTWHEAMAVNMADGYSRMRHDVGVASVTCGPGLAHIATALTAAVRNRSSIVVLAGDVPPTSKIKVQDLDQRRFVEACGAYFQPISSVDTLAADIRSAFFIARSRELPVVLNLPMDLQEKNIEKEFEYTPSRDFVTSWMPSASHMAIELLADALGRAHRPVILAGRGAMYAEAKDAIVKLADHSGALLVTTMLAKGLFAGHPYDLGIAGALASAAGEKLMKQADFVLLVGSEANPYALDGGAVCPEAEIARIDIRPNPDELIPRAGLYIQGDALETVTALNRMLTRRPVQQGFRTETTQLILDTPIADPEPPKDGLDPRKLMRCLSGTLPPQATITVGLGHYSSFPSQYLDLPAGAEIHYAMQFGAMATALGISLGIGVASPDRPHILIEGDGGLMMCMHTLETTVRHGIQLVIVVMNDCGYGAETHKFRSKGMDANSATWTSPDFVAISRAVGGDGVRLKSESEISTAIAAALQSGGLYVIDARISPTAVGNPTLKSAYGKPNQTPLLRGHSQPA